MFISGPCIIHPNPTQTFSRFKKGNTCLWTNLCKNRNPQAIHKDRNKQTYIKYDYSFSKSIDDAYPNLKNSNLSLGISQK